MVLLKSAPTVFIRLYSGILSFVHFAVVFPGTYALFPNKTKATYDRKIELLIANDNIIGKSLIFQLEPQVFDNFSIRLRNNNV